MRLGRDWDHTGMILGELPVIISDRGIQIKVTISVFHVMCVNEAGASSHNVSVTASKSTSDR